MFIGIDYSIVGSSCHIWTFNKHADGKHKRIIYIYILLKEKKLFSLCKICIKIKIKLGDKMQLIYAFRVRSYIHYKLTIARVDFI